MKISLNGEWTAKIDPEERGGYEKWASQPLDKKLILMVPGCIQQSDDLAEAYPPENEMRNTYLGTFFMEKEVMIPKLAVGEQCYFISGGIAPSCHIWINGEYVSGHIYGLTKVCLNITKYVVEGNNRITVAVSEKYNTLVSNMRFNGKNWSGIYSDTYIEVTGALKFDNTYISLKENQAKLCTLVMNEGSIDFEDKIEILLDDRIFTIPVFIKAESSKELSICVDVEGLPRWSFRKPQMIDVQIRCKDSYGNVCVCKFKTGLREIVVEGNRILVDNIPTFFAGAGTEYYSSTIAPLSDSKIIESRFCTFKDFGFNFYRYHTHVPTEEELSIADEMGIMVAVEFGLVSNFGKMTPIEDAFKMFSRFIQQTRKHPSLFIYGLGNEGSQVMTISQIERNKAKLGYKIIKENTDNQLGIIAFGIQGELPELENDFESAHLWSDHFRWAYDGLTDIPWEELENVLGGKPNIMHEYGKYCVWPSRKEEDDGTVENGVKLYAGTQGYNWLKKNGIEELEEKLVLNSRKAANSHIRIALEEARKQPYNSGYILWTFFRCGRDNRGVSDDLGINTNGEAELFRKGANANVSVLMERGFQNRAFPCGVEQSIDVYLSNFGLQALNGTIQVSVCVEETIIAKNKADITISVGEVKKAIQIQFAVPAAYAGKKLSLQAEFVVGDSVIAENKWELWAFDISADRNVRAYLHFDNEDYYRALKKVFPNAQKLSSVDSIVIGCRSWTQPQLAQTAVKNRDVLIISDVYDEVIRECMQNNCKILLLDSGRLPENWMSQPVLDLGNRDTSRFFTSFRSGWSHGNLVTNIEENTLLGTFPHEGFCDLHFFDMVQSARSIQKELVKDVFGEIPVRIISSFAHIKAEAEQGAILQDPNAIEQQEVYRRDTFNAREQMYFAKINVNTVICTLKLVDNAAGIALLKEIVKNL